MRELLVTPTHIYALIIARVTRFAIVVLAGAFLYALVVLFPFPAVAIAAVVMLAIVSLTFATFKPTTARPLWISIGIGVVLVAIVGSFTEEPSLRRVPWDWVFVPFVSAFIFAFIWMDLSVRFKRTFLGLTVRQLNSVQLAPFLHRSLNLDPRRFTRRLVGLSLIVTTVIGVASVSAVYTPGFHQFLPFLSLDTPRLLSIFMLSLYLLIILPPETRRDATRSSFLRFIFFYDTICRAYLDKVVIQTSRDTLAAQFAKDIHRNLLPVEQSERERFFKVLRNVTDQRHTSERAALTAYLQENGVAALYKELRFAGRREVRRKVDLPILLRDIHTGAFRHARTEDFGSTVLDKVQSIRLTSDTYLQSGEYVIERLGNYLLLSDVLLEIKNEDDRVVGLLDPSASLGDLVVRQLLEVRRAS